MSEGWIWENNLSRMKPEREDKDTVIVFRVAFRHQTLCLVDVTDSICVACFDASKIFRKPLQDLIGIGIADCICEQDRSSFEEFRSKICSGFSDTQSSILLQSKNHSFIWIEAYYIKKDTFNFDFYNYNSYKDVALPRETLDAIIGLQLFTTEYGDFLRQVVSKYSFPLNMYIPSEINTRNQERMSLINVPECPTNDDLLFSFDDEDEDWVRRP